jgi:tRNA(His) guanylyltransferase
VKDGLGSRMKDDYEFRTRTMLPRRTHTIIRLDGKAFHTYTRGLERPYDAQLMYDMATTARFLCEEVSGCLMAYTQSDEISLLLTDFNAPTTQAWFDGNVQKLVSVSASLATAKFNELRPGKLAFFDSRAFTIADPVEVMNYFLWRQKDATRNSISMAAQAKFSPKQLHGKSANEMQEMLWSEHGINWNNYDPRFKRGTAVVPERRIGDVSYVDKRSGETRVAEGVERRVWTVREAPIFGRADDVLPGLIRGLAPLPEASSEASQEEGHRDPS